MGRNERARGSRLGWTCVADSQGPILNVILAHVLGKRAWRLGNFLGISRGRFKAWSNLNPSCSLGLREYKQVASTCGLRLAFARTGAGFASGLFRSRPLRRCDRRKHPICKHGLVPLGAYCSRGRFLLPVRPRGRLDVPCVSVDPSAGNGVPRFGRDPFRPNVPAA
jgi:hypothetical protein